MDHGSLLLFAQGKKVNPDDAAAAVAGIGIAIAVYICVVLAIVAVLFALELWLSMTASKALTAVSEKNRDMSPGMAYLNLIPGLQAVWIFLTALWVASSLEKEYADRGLSGDGDFGKTFGIITGVGLVVCGPVGFIMMILYIFKLKGYTAALGSGGKRSKSRDDDDE